MAALLLTLTCLTVDNAEGVSPAAGMSGSEPGSAPQSQPLTDMRDHGVHSGDNGDITPALQAMIDGTPDWGEIVAPPGWTRICISRTINFVRRSGIWFHGRTNARGGGGLEIQWCGPDGGTMFNLDSSRELVFENLSIYGHNPAENPDHSRGAAVGIAISQQSGGNTSTHNTFRNMAISGDHCSARGWTAVDIGTDLNNNSEFMVFEHMSIRGMQGGIWQGKTYCGGQTQITGTGVRIRHANAKSESFSDINIGSLDTFIQMDGGSFVARDIRGGATRTVYHIMGASTEPLTIDNDNFEVVCQAVKAEVSVPLRISGRYNALRYAPFGFQGCASDNLPLFDFSRGGTIVVGNLVVDRGVRLFRGGDGTLILEGGDYESNASAFPDKGLQQFSIAYIFGRDGLTVMGSAKAATAPTPGFHLNSEAGGMIRGLYTSRESGSYPGHVPCAPGSLATGDCELEITGLRSGLSMPVATVVGTPGSATYLLAAVPRDASGNRGLRSQLATVRNAPSAPDAGNYIHFDWSNSAVQGAVSYDLVMLESFSKAGWHLIASVPARSCCAYDIKTVPNPGNDWSYVIPTQNESGGINLRVPQGLRLYGRTHLKCYSDEGSTQKCDINGATGDARFSTLSAAKLLGVTDSSVVPNLDADLLDGKHASDFTAAPVAIPRTPSSNCSAGAWTYDSGYIYVCTATNTWKRATLASW
jgi:hypothetical protein